MKITSYRLNSTATLIACIGTLSLSAGHHKSDPLSPANLKPHNAVVESVNYKGKQAIKGEISEEAREKLAGARRLREAGRNSGGPAAAEAGRVDHLIVVGEDFHNGTIELKIAGEPAPGATGGARGFVGVAFRVQEDMATYDCFYLRPTNGRANDQERRNHSAQYIFHPDYPWFRLRQETPSKYEAYVDLEPATWTDIKIVVEGETAKLYVHGNDQPTLIVNDLKSGADGKGAVALWFEGSTIAHYSDLKITK